MILVKFSQNGNIYLYYRHGWLHMTHLEPPAENKTDFQRIIDTSKCPTENMSGSGNKYLPYSTIENKIIEWKKVGK